MVIGIEYFIKRNESSKNLNNKLQIKWNERKNKKKLHINYSFQNLGMYIILFVIYNDSL